mgnify:CR=1 FL=1
MKFLIDKVVFTTILLMVSLPYARAIFPVIGEINVKSHMLLFLLIMLIINFVTQKSVDKFYLLNIVGAVFLIYFCVSIIFGSDLSVILYQVFSYVPFMISCLIIVVGTTIRYELLSKWIVYAVALSGLLAMYLFYFNTQLMPSINSSEANFSWGRLPWRGSSNVLICLGIVLFSFNRSSKSMLSIVGVLIGLIAALLTFSRTLLLGIIIMAIVWLIYSLYMKKISQHWRFFLVLIVSSYVVFYFDIITFDNVLHNINSRVLGFLTMESDIAGHVSDRELLYSQYYDVFARYPLGAGFGVPFSTETGVSYYSDVTLVSFVLPFGVLGLFMFILYISKLWSLLNLVRMPVMSTEKVGLKIVIILGLLISFNDDIWSHKEFTIVIALVVSSFVNSYRNKKKEY